MFQFIIHYLNELKTTVEVLFEFGWMVKKSDASYLIYRSTEKQLKIILQNGLDISELSQHFIMSLIIYDSENKRMIDYHKKIKILSDYGLNLNNVHDNKICYLVASQLNFFKKFIENGFNLNNLNSQQKVIILTCANLDSVKFFFKKGLKLNIQDYDMGKLINLSTLIMLQLFLENGLNLSTVDLSKIDSSALVEILRKPQGEVEFLIKNGFNLSTVDLRIIEETTVDGINMQPPKIYNDKLDWLIGSNYLDLNKARPHDIALILSKRNPIEISKFFICDTEI